MSNEVDYASISPYTDEEAVKALRRVAQNPFLPIVSKFLFPDEPFYTLRRLLKSINSIDEFQQVVMSKMIMTVIQRSSSGFTFDGLENVPKDRKFLAVSNHRDIILDPAMIQWTLFHNDLPLTEICVGSNLLRTVPFFEVVVFIYKRSHHLRWQFRVDCTARRPHQKRT